MVTGRQWSGVTTYDMSTGTAFRFSISGPNVSVALQAQHRIGRGRRAAAGKIDCQRTYRGLPSGDMADSDGFAKALQFLKFSPDTIAKLGGLKADLVKLWLW